MSVMFTPPPPPHVHCRLPFARDWICYWASSLNWTPRWWHFSSYCKLLAHCVTGATCSASKNMRYVVLFFELPPPPQNTSKFPAFHHRPRLKTLCRDSQEMNMVITKASVLAESVRSKVHVLDIAKVRRLMLSHMHPLVPTYLHTHTHTHTLQCTIAFLTGRLPLCVHVHV